MDGVGTPIIGRPRPLPSHDTPNPAHNTYTLKCEEPETWASACGPDATVPKQLMGAAVSCLVAGACFSIANRLFNRR